MVQSPPEKSAACCPGRSELAVPSHLAAGHRGLVAHHALPCASGVCAHGPRDLPLRAAQDSPFQDPRGRDDHAMGSGVGAEGSLGAPSRPSELVAPALKAWLAEEPTRWVLVAAGVFLAANILSTLFSTSLQVSLWGNVPAQDAYALYTVVSYFLLFIIIATHLKTREQLWRFLGGDGCSRGGDRALRHPSALRPGPRFLPVAGETQVHYRQRYLFQRHPRDDDPYNAGLGVHGPGGTPVLVGCPDMGKPRYCPAAGHRLHCSAVGRG